MSLHIDNSATDLNEDTPSPQDASDINGNPSLSPLPNTTSPLSSNNDDSKRRQRSCNFSDEEIDVLIEKMKLHSQHLYGNQLNRKAKTKLWEEITQAVS